MGLAFYWPMDMGLLGSPSLISYFILFRSYCIRCNIPDLNPYVFHFFFFFVVHYLFETSKLNIINFLSLINAKFVILFMSFSVTSSSSTMQVPRDCIERSLNPFSDQIEEILCLIQDCIDTILEPKNFQRKLNLRIILLYQNIKKENCTHLFINTILQF